MINIRRIDNLDSIIERISSFNNIIKEVQGLIDFYGLSFMDRIMLRAIRLGNMKVANGIYKSMILNRIYRANIFVSEFQGNNHESYLATINEEEKRELVDDIIMKINMGFGSNIDYECLKVLRSLITNQSKEALSYKLIG